MRPSSLRAALIAVAAVAFASAAAAQVETGRAIQQKAPRVRVEKFKGEVLASNAYQIIVRSRENEKVVRTYTLNPQAKAEMLKVIDLGGYQVGDRVEVHHEPGSNVALKIKGKPSRPR